MYTIFPLWDYEHFQLNKNVDTIQYMYRTLARYAEYFMYTLIYAYTIHVHVHVHTRQVVNTHTHTRTLVYMYTYMYTVHTGRGTCIPSKNGMAF